MRWVGVPDNAIVYVKTQPLYPAVGGPDELTDVLDLMADNATGSVQVIDLP